MAHSSLIVFSVLFATVFAEVVKIKSCPDVDLAMCTVSQVRVDPCRDYKKGKCVFKKGGEGTNAALSFDFTPNFAASRLKTNAYWNNGVMDVPFPDIGSDDACLYTTCPSQTGNTQTLNYNLHLASKLPSGTFEFKWMVWDADNATHTCCFMTSVQLKK